MRIMLEIFLKRLGPPLVVAMNRLIIDFLTTYSVNQIQ